MKKSKKATNVLQKELTALQQVKEVNRHLSIAQRAVDASVFLPIHGFLTEAQAWSLVEKAKKYMAKHNFILVDKAFKKYIVLLADARVHPKWRMIFGERAKK